MSQRKEIIEAKRKEDRLHLKLYSVIYLLKKVVKANLFSLFFILKRYNLMKKRFNFNHSHNQNSDSVLDLLLGVEQVMLFIIDGCIPFTFLAFSILFANAMVNGVVADMKLATISVIEFLFFMLTRATYYKDLEDNNVKPLDAELISVVKWFANLLNRK